MTRGPRDRYRAGGRLREAELVFERRDAQQIRRGGIVDQQIAGIDIGNALAEDDAHKAKLAHRGIRRRVGDDHGGFGGPQRRGQGEDQRGEVPIGFREALHENKRWELEQHQRASGDRESHEI